MRVMLWAVGAAALIGCAAPSIEPMTDKERSAAAAAERAWHEAGLPELSAECAALFEAPPVRRLGPRAYRQRCGCAYYDRRYGDSTCAPPLELPVLGLACELDGGAWGYVYEPELSELHRLLIYQVAVLYAVASCEGVTDAPELTLAEHGWCSAMSYAWHIGGGDPTPCGDCERWAICTDPAAL